MTAYVGIDLHRRRSLAVCLDDAGERLWRRPVSLSHPRQLCSWAGLTPRLRESDSRTYRGHITKQGSTLVGWSAVEAVSRYHGGTPIRDSFHRIAERRGRNIAQVAAARKLLTLGSTG